MYKNSFLVKFLEREEEESRLKEDSRKMNQSPDKKFEYNEEEKIVTARAQQQPPKPKFKVGIQKQAARQK